MWSPPPALGVCPGRFPTYPPPILSLSPSGGEGRPVSWGRPRLAPGEHACLCRGPQVRDTQSPDGAGCRGLGGLALGVCPCPQVQKLLPKGFSQSSDCGHPLVAQVLGGGGEAQAVLGRLGSRERRTRELLWPPGLGGPGRARGWGMPGVRDTGHPLRH